MNIVLDIDKLWENTSDDDFRNIIACTDSPKALDYMAKELDMDDMLLIQVCQNSKTYKSTVRWVVDKAIKEDNWYLLNRLKINSKISDKQRKILNKMDFI